MDLEFRRKELIKTESPGLRNYCGHRSCGRETSMDLVLRVEETRWR